jgi:chromosome segregation ATPase
MIENTQATKPNNAKLLKELESKKTEWEREIKVLQVQIEPLRETLAGIPVRVEDCTQEQWQQRCQLQDAMSKLERPASSLKTQLVYLDKDIDRLSTLLNADKQMVANNKRGQELTSEVGRLRDGAERVQRAMKDIEAKHEDAGKSADMALQLAVQARARATATGDFLASTAAEKATQEATAERQRAHQANEHDAPLLTALRAEAEAIDAQIASVLKEQDIAREKVRTSQIAKLEDAWDQQVQALVTIGNHLVSLGSNEAFRSMKIPHMADRSRSVSYRDLLDDPSVLLG